MMNFTKDIAHGADVCVLNGCLLISLGTMITQTDTSDKIHSGRQYAKCGIYTLRTSFYSQCHKCMTVPSELENVVELTPPINDYERKGMVATHHN
jgi:hypothetical protein